MLPWAFPGVNSEHKDPRVIPKHQWVWLKKKNTLNWLDPRMSVHIINLLTYIVNELESMITKVLSNSDKPQAYDSKYETIINVEAGTINLDLVQ